TARAGFDEALAVRADRVRGRLAGFSPALKESSYRRWDHQRITWFLDRCASPGAEPYARLAASDSSKRVRPRAPRMTQRRSATSTTRPTNKPSFDVIVSFFAETLAAVHGQRRSLEAGLSSHLFSAFGYPVVDGRDQRVVAEGLLQCGDGILLLGARQDQYTLDSLFE
ncbi:hypothetical protein AB0M86_49050, partial [Streptomyces sp. NPDC051639]